MAVAAASQLDADASRTLLRRQQRKHTKASYQQLKAKLLALVKPMPQASRSRDLEEFRSSLYCAAPGIGKGGQLIQCSWCGVSLSIADSRREGAEKPLAEPLEDVPPQTAVGEAPVEASAGTAAAVYVAPTAAEVDLAEKTDGGHATKVVSEAARKVAVEAPEACVVKPLALKEEPLKEVAEKPLAEPLEDVPPQTADVLSSDWWSQMLQAQPSAAERPAPSQTTVQAVDKLGAHSSAAERPAESPPLQAQEVVMFRRDATLEQMLSACNVVTPKISKLWTACIEKKANLEGSGIREQVESLEGQGEQTTSLLLPDLPDHPPVQHVQDVPKGSLIPGSVRELLRSLGVHAPAHMTSEHLQQELRQVLQSSSSSRKS